MQRTSLSRGLSCGQQRGHSHPPAGEESDRGLAEGLWLPAERREVSEASPSLKWGAAHRVTKRSHPQPGMSSLSQISIETSSRRSQDVPGSLTPPSQTPGLPWETGLGLESFSWARI